MLSRSSTSPTDQLYLLSVARAARRLKESRLSVKIDFIRCPVDFSERYAAVISEYSDVIVEVPPLWKRIGDGWNTILPTVEDIHLQVNLMRHCEGVINLGSSMVFDAVAHKKTCAYMNYNSLNVQMNILMEFMCMILYILDLCLQKKRYYR